MYSSRRNSVTISYSFMYVPSLCRPDEQVVLLAVFALFKWLPSPAEGSLIKTLGRGLKNPLKSPYKKESFPSHCRSLSSFWALKAAIEGRRAESRHPSGLIHFQPHWNHYSQESTLSIPFVVFPPDPFLTGRRRSVE